MKILIIAEDYRHDQYILKPILKAMMAHLGKPNTKIQMCIDPLIRGISQALNWSIIEEVIDMHQWIDLFIICVDRDGKSGAQNSLNRLEEKAATILTPAKHLIGENAWQEVEVWALAGHDLPNQWSWQDIRAEVSLKETYFEPFVALEGLQDSPGRGRKILGEAAARRYPRIRKLCKADVLNLENRISTWMGETQ